MRNAFTFDLQVRVKKYVAKLKEISIVVILSVGNVMESITQRMGIMYSDIS